MYAFHRRCGSGCIEWWRIVGHHFLKKIADMEERFGALEASMAETEKTVKKQAAQMEKEKKAAEAVRQFDNRLNLMPILQTSWK